MSANCDMKNLKEETLSKFTGMKWIRRADSSPARNDENGQQHYQNDHRDEQNDHPTNSVIQNSRCKISGMRSQLSYNIEGNNRYKSDELQERVALPDIEEIDRFRSDGSIGSGQKCRNDSDKESDDYFGLKELLERRQKFRGISKLFFKFILPNEKNFNNFCFKNEMLLRRNFRQLFSHFRRNENVEKRSVENSTGAPSEVSSSLNAQAAPFWPQTVKNADSSHRDLEKGSKMAVSNFSPQVPIARSIQQVRSPAAKKPLEKGLTRGVILNRPPAPAAVFQGANFPSEQAEMKVYLQRTLDQLNADRLNNMNIYQGDDENASISLNEPKETGTTSQPSVANDINTVTPQYIVHSSSMPNVCMSSSTSLTTHQSLPNARSGLKPVGPALRPCGSIANDPNSGIREFASGPPVEAISDVVTYNSWRGQQQTSRWSNDSVDSLGSLDSRSKSDDSTSPYQSQQRKYSSCADYSKAADVSTSPEVHPAISSNCGNHSNPKPHLATSGFSKSDECDISAAGIELNQRGLNHRRPSSTNHANSLPQHQQQQQQQQHASNSSLLCSPVGTNTTVAFSNEPQSSFVKGLKGIPSYSTSSEHHHLSAASNATMQLTPSSPVLTKSSIVSSFNQTTPRPPIAHLQVTSPQHHLAVASLSASAVPGQHISKPHLLPEARNVPTQPTPNALLALQQNISGPHYPNMAALQSANVVVDQIITSQRVPHAASNVVMRPTSDTCLAAHQSISHQYRPDSSRIHDNASAPPQWIHTYQRHLHEANHTSMQQHTSSSPVATHHCKSVVEQGPQDTDGFSCNASPVLNGNHSNQNGSHGVAEFTSQPQPMPSSPSLVQPNSSVECPVTKASAPNFKQSCSVSSTANFSYQSGSHGVNNAVSQAPPCSPSRMQASPFSQYSMSVASAPDLQQRGSVSSASNLSKQNGSRGVNDAVSQPIPPSPSRMQASHSMTIASAPNLEQRSCVSNAANFANQSGPNSISSAANFMRHLCSTFQQPNTAALQPRQLVTDSSVKPASDSCFPHHYNRVDAQFVTRPEPIANVQHRPSSSQPRNGDDVTSPFSEQAHFLNSRSDSLTLNVQDEYLRSLVNARVSSRVSFEP